MSTASTIVAVVKTALEGVSGLSADRVVRGYPGDGPSPPVAWVAMDQISSEHGPDLGGETQTMTINVWASPASDGSTHAIREDACMDLMSALLAAIQGSTSLLALLISPPICASKADVQGAGGPGTPLIVVVIKCKYVLDYGGGI